MTTPDPSPFEADPQLLQYLQAWRRLLEPLAAMTPPNLIPPCPGTPPPPQSPAPGAYAEQLFGYLQNWRRHLEQMAATASAPPPDPGGPPAGGTPGGTGPAPGHMVVLKPEYEGTTFIAPMDETMAPDASPDLVRQAAPRARGAQVDLPPVAEFGSRSLAGGISRETPRSAPRPVAPPATASRPEAPIAAPTRFKGLADRALKNQHTG